MLARQVLMNCVPSPNKSLAPPGCDGGDPWMIHKYLKLSCTAAELEAMRTVQGNYLETMEKSLETEFLGRFCRKTIC